MTRVTPVLIVALTVLASSATAGLAATPPGARTGGASDITSQTATLKGTVNPHGVPTAFYFQFGRTKGYGTRTSTSDAGSGLKGRGISAPVTGLMPLTIYHYRLVAFSTAGTTRGGDRTFRTPQIPTASTISVSPNPVVYGKTVFVSGALTGPDIGGKKVALQSKPFPFTGPFQQIGNTVLSSPVGAYSFIWPPTVTMQLRVLDQSRPSVKSPIFTASVALATTLRVRNLHRSRRPILFRGHVTARSGWKPGADPAQEAKGLAHGRLQPHPRKDPLVLRLLEKVAAAPPRQVPRRRQDDGRGLRRRHEPLRADQAAPSQAPVNRSRSPGIGTTVAGSVKG